MTNIPSISVKLKREKLLVEVANRYRKAKPSVDAVKEKLAKNETPFLIDSTDRAGKRLVKLGFDAIGQTVMNSASVNVPYIEKSLKHYDEIQRISVERILGTNDLLNASFVEGAATALPTICRVKIQISGNTVVGYGTGFLVAPNILMTNNHVLDSSELARTSLAEFNYQQLRDGTMKHSSVFGLDPDSLFYTNEELDFTIVGVKAVSIRGERLEQFGWNRLVAEEGKILKGEKVNVIQHPNGEPKQVAIRENRLISLLDPHLHYETDTDSGSSGSPIFNDQWQVVGIHHSGVPDSDDQGNLYTKDPRRIWNPATDHANLLNWVANEGIRISRVIGQLTKVGIDLYSSVTESSESTKHVIHQSEGPRDTTSASGITQELSEDHITWTIPIKVSVGLGLGNQGSSVTHAPPIAPSNAIPVQSKSGYINDSELRNAFSELERSVNRLYYDAAADERAKDAYYGNINLNSQDLWEQLVELLEKTHIRQPSYKPAVHLYPWVDLYPEKTLKSIYTREAYSPQRMIEEAFEIDRNRAVVERRIEEIKRRSPQLNEAERTATIIALEAALAYNCEHVVPQSWFSKREPMRGDLHHLFTCESTCNSFRGNIPYFDFIDYEPEEVVRASCGKREEDRFEPFWGKGEVARATFYFLTRYPGIIQKSDLSAERVDMLIEWHKLFPVTIYENHRNSAIFSKQGNRNPYIDFPGFVEKVDFTIGLS